MSEEYEISSNADEFSYSYWIKKYQELQNENEALKKKLEITMEAFDIADKLLAKSPYDEWGFIRRRTIFTLENALAKIAALDCKDGE
jgi:hypothetical protein